MFQVTCNVVTWLSQSHSNIIVNYCLQNCFHPPKVLTHGCDLHDTHSCSEHGIVRGDFVNQMFCTSAVLRAGPVWMDLKASMNHGLSLRDDGHVTHCNSCLQGELMIIP